MLESGAEKGRELREKKATWQEQGDNGTGWIFCCKKGCHDQTTKRGLLTAGPGPKEDSKTSNAAEAVEQGTQYLACIGCVMGARSSTETSILARHDGSETHGLIEPETEIDLEGENLDGLHLIICDDLISKFRPTCALATPATPLSPSPVFPCLALSFFSTSVPPCLWIALAPNIKCSTPYLPAEQATTAPLGLAIGKNGADTAADTEKRGDIGPRPSETCGFG